MSDIHELLDRTARSAAGPPSTETIEADLLRGRTAMARRRRRRAIALPIAGTFGLAVLAGTTFVAGDIGRTGQIPAPPASSTRHVSGIQLVAYKGDQLDGFIVEQVPDGWYLQGSSQARLTIAPKGDKGSPDNFVGKLVVMLISADAPQQLPDGEPVKVGEYDGVITRDPDNINLFYKDGNGRIVEIQAWHERLGWSSAELIRFAEGVTVTADAVAGVG